MKTDEIATKQDIQELARVITDKLTEINNKISTAESAKTFTVCQLAKIGTIGKYTRIKTLIRKGILKALPDGRITQKEITNYLNLKEQNC